MQQTSSKVSLMKTTPRNVIIKLLTICDEAAREKLYKNSKNCYKLKEAKNSGMISLKCYEKKTTYQLVCLVKVSFRSKRIFFFQTSER